MTTMMVVMDNGMRLQNWRARDPRVSHDEAEGWLAEIHTEWKQITDSDFRLRILTKRPTNNSYTISALVFRLQRSINGEGWQYVTDISNWVRLVLTPFYENQDDSTDVFLGSGNMIIDNNNLVEAGLTGRTGPLTWPAANRAVESEWALTLRPQQPWQAGDSVEFRLLASEEVFTNTPLNGYPTLSIPDTRRRASTVFRI